MYLPSDGDVVLSTAGAPSRSNEEMAVMETEPEPAVLEGQLGCRITHRGDLHTWHETLP
jgi:hypothetical protein